MLTNSFFLNSAGIWPLKPTLRKIALERMQILIHTAVSGARADPALAQKQALLARRLSTRYRIRMPYHLRMVFCRRCKMFIAPGAGARFRLGRSPVKAVRITCCFCGHTYRKIISSKQPRTALVANHQ